MRQLSNVEIWLSALSGLVFLALAMMFLRRGDLTMTVLLGVAGSGLLWLTVEQAGKRRRS